MKITANYTAHIATALLMLTPMTEAHSQPTLQTVAAECTTRPTGGDARRHSCNSAASVINAPDNFVFIKDGPKGLSGGEFSGRGSEHWCIYEWSNYVEIIPDSGIVAPRTFSLRAHARGPRDRFAGRGWSKCKYELSFTSYVAH